MRLSADDQKKLIAVAVFLLLAGGILYYELSGTSGSSAPVPQAASAPPAANVSRPQTKIAESTNPPLDPTLKMGPMLMTEALVYSGNGRNIFSPTSVPMEIPKPIAPARPKAVVAASPAMPAGPPPPPPINLKFFGTATSKNGTRQAFLLRGDDVFLAVTGEVVDRHYKVISIAANSIVIEDMTNNNRQTLPLLTN